jgi:hypothetical protein
MQTKEKKNILELSKIHQSNIKEIFNDNKFVKPVIFFGAGMVGLFALGFFLKAMNYTALNFKLLSRTIKL